MALNLQLLSPELGRKGASGESGRERESCHRQEARGVASRRGLPLRSVAGSRAAFLPASPRTGMGTEHWEETLGSGRALPVPLLAGTWGSGSPLVVLHSTGAPSLLSIRAGRREVGQGSTALVSPGDFPSPSSSPMPTKTCLTSLQSKFASPSLFEGHQQIAVMEVGLAAVRAAGARDQPQWQTLRRARGSLHAC